MLGVSMVFFLSYPDIDLQVSTFFYDANTLSFPGKEWPWVKWIYIYTPEINKWISIGAAIFLLLTWIRPHSSYNKLRRRCIAWLLMVIIGIGFIVDWVLKDHVGRPHPYQTVNFNGTDAFVPVLHYQPLCEENCSFVSGHAAGGFVWMAWGMWSRRQTRRRWIWAGIGAGSLIGLTRMLQGGHFLSDVVFSGWFIWLTYWLIRSVWIRWRWYQVHRLHQPQNL
jgi:lipid A 4'-phosphatase